MKGKRNKCIMHAYNAQFTMHNAQLRYRPSGDRFKIVCPRSLRISGAVVFIKVFGVRGVRSAAAGGLPEWASCARRAHLNCAFMHALSATRKTLGRGFK